MIENRNLHPSKSPIGLDPREGPPKGAPSKGLVKSRGNRSRKSRASPSSNFAHRAPKFSKIAPRSIEIRCSPDLPKRQPNGSQARAAMPSIGVALSLNSDIFSPTIETVQNCWEMFRFGKLNSLLNARFAITLFLGPSEMRRLPRLKRSKPKP